MKNCKEYCAAHPKIESDILLVGHPNVGKSVLFSRITGIKTIASNYPGSTVCYMEGNTGYNNENYKIIDAPGTYSLEPVDDATRVTVSLLKNSQRIINVVDATHLERHLPLTIELIEQKKSMVIALNMSDEARHLGVDIDVKKLSARLGVPVIPTVARTGEGVKELVETVLAQPLTRESFSTALNPHPHIPRHNEYTDKSSIPAGPHMHLKRDIVWKNIYEIVESVQTLRHRHHTFRDMLEDLSVQPFWGFIVAVLSLLASFALIRLTGEFLINGSVGIFGEPWFEIPFGIEPVFEKILKPLLMKLSVMLGSGSLAHKILIGNLINGDIDFVQSFGILTSGLFIPIGAVLPYIISYYFVISLLEDTGYLPRLAVFLDSIMHRMGLHGYAIIPTLLGIGCNVPGILATRILETKQQRFITSTLISIAVPCAALQAMIIGFVGRAGLWAVAFIYATLFITWFVVGFILKYTVKGYKPELLLEIPPYRLPSFSALKDKVLGRILAFIKEAIPIVVLSVFIVNVLYMINIFDYIADFFAPLITRLWGMPRESIVPMLIGILRKDVAVGLFAPLNLTVKQLITGSVVLSMFFPCIATFVVLIKELGIVSAMKSTAIMLVVVTVVGSLINLIL
ncbi:MAG: ferrous iron transport protein B [Oligoflexia bacterium]|nr:ferrous iron transport protein B [Oligoflexia bacterium]